MKISLERKDLVESCKNLKVNEIKYNHFKSEIRVAILVSDVVTFEDNSEVRVIKSRLG